jgi:hypothetical protein
VCYGIRCAESKRKDYSIDGGNVVRLDDQYIMDMEIVPSRVKKHTVTESIVHRSEGEQGVESRTSISKNLITTPVARNSGTLFKSANPHTTMAKPEMDRSGTNAIAERKAVCL